jgi:7-cyano-7-deazaguanine synthase
MKTALLLSGGMDSVAIAYWLRPKMAFTVDYGQLSSKGEIRTSAIICQSLDIKHEILKADCKNLGSGDLAGKPSLPEAPESEWWPFRNQLLLTLTGMRAVSIGINHLLFGSVKTDSFHADGRSQFFDQVNSLFQMQEGVITVEAPAIHLTTAELIKVSGIPRSLLGWAHSCHVTDFACGNCRGCLKHRLVLKELGYEMD